jgi:carbamoyl-phosphate synthase large subunit
MSQVTKSSSGAGSGRQDVRILFSCAGRRVELITAFRRAAEGLGIRAVFHVSDADALVAAASVTEHAHQVPAVRSEGYVPALLELVGRERIDLLVPLLDPELLSLSNAREEFAERGCGVLISSPEVVEVAQDKLRCFEFLRQRGIPTPETWEGQHLLKLRPHRFPYFLKPRWGSASQGNFVIRNEDDLQMMATRVPNAIIQEFIDGTEHTLDVYAGFDGRPRCVVPRERLEVRGGEVTKARTVRQRAIMDVGARVVEALGKCVGVITIQVFVTADKGIQVIEINPRFGGGVPLAIHAGADFPRWLLSEWLGRQPDISLDAFRDNVTMLRYHQSVFVEADGCD